MTFGQSEIRKRLKRTWVTFFGRHGRLLPVQIKTIPVVMDGKNAIIMSPTASGKTEAVIAPLLERFLQGSWKNLSILYVSPTRALVNDMYYRLEDQMADFQVKVSMKTSDKPSFKPDNPPNVIITTPESLDSLICRHPQAFRDLQAVVLDEIHLIDNNYRGDQIRMLLRRLESISENNFNTYALSATMADAESLGIRYMKDFEIIQIPGRREIEYTFVRSLQEVYKYTKAENLRKLLIFCNTRAFTESLSAECKNSWGMNKVVVHHGSLSKQIREEAESFMKETKYGVCVATMTLEIGIDIGDIDAVVLAEVPWSISSLLQRIGRGNRRKQFCRVFALYNSEEEKLMFEKMINAARNGNLESKSYFPDLSVVIQQIFSSLFAQPSGLEVNHFLELFSEFCSKSDLIDVLKHLEKRGG